MPYEICGIDFDKSPVGGVTRAMNEEENKYLMTRYYANEINDAFDNHFNLGPTYKELSQ